MSGPDTLFGKKELARGDALFRQTFNFVKGVVSLEHLPPMSVPEIAFSGRSNVGKSSLINALTHHGKLARTSNTPGRTQELNFFRDADETFYIVDMPGYGYAEAPKAKVEAWTELIKDYLRGRSSLKRVFVLIDSRHGIKPVDEEILAMLDVSAVSYQIVLTKADKPGANELASVRATTAAVIAKRPAAYPLLLETSSVAGDGLAELRAAIAGCLGFSGRSGG
jgi:GTP-binding protein